MPGAFAVLETRVNAAVLERISNAIASVPGGRDMPVIFDEAYIAALGMVESAGPAATADDADIAGLALEQDSTLTIRGVDYVIRGIQPDGTGMSVLLLRLQGEC